MPRSRRSGPLHRLLTTLTRRRPVRAGTRSAPAPAPGPGNHGLVLEYRPRLDGRPDPGEVVWTWVPYEDDPAQGKDRPVLIIGRLDDDLAGLMLTSKDHDRDAEQESRRGRHWRDVGTGAWDRERRPSEVRLDRLIPVQATSVRREGAAVDQALFENVVAEARRYLP
ncbi:MAG: type II toxin-antitoxin system PemK/MazF family toxin [Nocardioidaceae bacterium]